MDESKVLTFLRRYVYLTPQHEAMVVDFVRQARLGEGPQLVVYGAPAAGKTRLRLCLTALIPNLLAIESGIRGPLSEWLLKQDPIRPTLALTVDRGQLEKARGLVPCIALPLVWLQKLLEAGVQIGANWDEIREDWAEASGEVGHDSTIA